MNVKNIWWRRITANDLFNIEKPLPPGPKGQLHLDVPNVSSLHAFFGVSHDELSDHWKPIGIELHALRDPSVVRRVTFRPRPKNNRYDIQRQNINSDSSERHPAWTSAYGWPAIHGKIKSTSDASDFLSRMPITILILKDDKNQYYADFLLGTPDLATLTNELTDIYQGKSSGALIEISVASWSILENLLNPDSKDLIGTHTPVSIKRKPKSSVKPLRKVNRSKSQGFGLSPQLRRAVEKYAVKLATDYFEGKGWLNIQDVGDFASYDLTMVRDGVVHIVEVKGTTGLGESVILTKNEVAVHNEHYPNNALVVVSEITIDSSDPILLSGGKLRIVQPWSLIEEWLTALTYNYPVVKHEAEEF